MTALKVAWMFPGQGAQTVGMGKDVAAASAAARRVFERADEALGQPLSTLCFEGPSQELTLTANTQPAICATSMALLAALQERHPDLPLPVAAAGHSLGEYSALCAAGVLTLGDAITTCRSRGEAMQEAVPEGVGAMAAVIKVDGMMVASLCETVDRPGHVVSCANFNSPGQTAIAGHAAAVKEVAALVKAQGGRALPLKVSAPFHCALMKPVRGALSEVLSKIDMQPPRFDVLANVDAEVHVEAPAIVEALLEQVYRPVRWVETIRALHARGVTHVLEIGPGKVLSGLLKRIEPSMKALAVCNVEALELVPEFLQEGS